MVFLPGPVVQAVTHRVPGRAEKVIVNGIEKGDIKPVNARAVAFILNMGFESFYLTHKSEGLGISSDEYIEFWERLLREGIAVNQESS